MKDTVTIALTGGTWAGIETKMAVKLFINGTDGVYRFAETQPAASVTAGNPIEQSDRGLDIAADTKLWFLTDDDGDLYAEDARRYSGSDVSSNPISIVSLSLMVAL